ncbi:hypothetical protein CR513_00621, partial [Mucuna pruriens]
MRWCIEWILLIIPKPMGRLRSLIGRSNRFCKWWHTPIEKIGVVVRGCSLGSQDSLSNTVRNVPLLDNFWIFYPTLLDAQLLKDEL